MKAKDRLKIKQTMSALAMGCIVMAVGPANCMAEEMEIIEVEEIDEEFELFAYYEDNPVMLCPSDYFFGQEEIESDEVTMGRDLGAGSFRWEDGLIEDMDAEEISTQCGSVSSDDDDDYDSDDEDSDDDGEDGEEEEEEVKEPEQISFVTVVNASTTPAAYRAPSYKAKVEYGNASIVYEGWVGSDQTVSYSSSAAYHDDDCRFKKFKNGGWYSYMICLEAQGEDYFADNAYVQIGGNWYTGTLSADKTRLYIRGLFQTQAVCVHDLKYTTIKPTCEAQGYMNVVCNYCGKTEKRNIVPAVGHSYAEADGDEDAAEPTCENAGLKVEECEKCGKKKTTVLPALGHHYERDDENCSDATCTAYGVIAYKCTRSEDCERAYTERGGKPTGHHFVRDTESDQAPTCTQDGYYAYKCSSEECEETKKTVRSKLGHNFSGYEVDAQATTSKNGCYHYNCVNDECEAATVDTTIFRINKMKLSATSFAYNGSPRVPGVTVTDLTGKVIPAKYYTVTCYNNTKVGTATVHVRFNTLYKGTMEQTFKITQASQSISAKVTTQTYKKATVAKKAQTFQIGAAAKTKLTYKSGNTKYVTVSSSGKVTVKKGTPKGTYKISVSAAKSTNYKAAAKTITVKVS